MTLPAWLLDLSTQLKTQDNRITSDPIFLVQQKRRIYGLDPEYAEEYEFEWLHEDEGYGPDEYVQLALEAWREAGGQEDMPYRRLAYLDTWEFVQCFFTNQAAQDYIQINKHRLNEPRVYVDSGYRNHEWIQLRRFLSSISDKTCATCGSSFVDKRGTFCTKTSWQDESRITHDDVPEDGYCHRWSFKKPQLVK